VARGEGGGLTTGGSYDGESTSLGKKMTGVSHLERPFRIVGTKNWQLEKDEFGTIEGFFNIEKHILWGSK